VIRRKLLLEIIKASGRLSSRLKAKISTITISSQFSEILAHNAVYGP
jgi:hypothetical protein